jgi:hypothetical protein
VQYAFIHYSYNLIARACPPSYNSLIESPTSLLVEPRPRRH